MNTKEETINKEALIKLEKKVSKTIKPAPGHYLVVPRNSKKHEINGVVLGDRVHGNVSIGEIVDVGAPTMNENGYIIEYAFNIGDIVFIHAMAFTPVMIRKVHFGIVKQSQILCKIEWYKGIEDDFQLSPVSDNDPIKIIDAKA